MRHKGREAPRRGVLFQFDERASGLFLWFETLPSEHLFLLLPSSFFLTISELVLIAVFSWFFGVVCDFGTLAIVGCAWFGWQPWLGPLLVRCGCCLAKGLFLFCVGFVEKWLKKASK